MQEMDGHNDLLFFLIGNEDIYSRTLPYAEKHKAERKLKREKKEYKDKERKRYQVHRRELRNIGRESLEVILQALDQSNKVPLKEANSWSSELSMSSYVLLFRSFQRHHIKHNEAKFQMLNECFPGQFHQPNRVSATNLGKTQENPKDLNTKLHNQ